MSLDPTSSYDELPYTDHCFAESHPDYLATIGRLFQIDTPDLRTCRVLELGCGTGGNMIPMALELPDARFLGIDLSSRQIDGANRLIDRLGIANVEFKAMDIMDFDDRFGSFDYIICHGVYSWVPERVRDKILEILATRLNPSGIAYLSYNTYPGWHGRGIVRELMAFHVREAASAIDRVEKARDLLDNIVQILPDPSSSYGRILIAEKKFLEGVANSYLYHEHLEETNHPVYFRELMGLASAKGLQYLAEAKKPGLLANLPAESREMIESWAEDEVAAEQYLDFIYNRTFRRTIFCRADCERLATPSAEDVSSFWVGSNVVPVNPAADLSAETAEEFRRPDGAAGLTSNNPTVKSALFAIHDARHHPIPFKTLLDMVGTRLGVVIDDDTSQTLKHSLLKCFLSNLVDLHVNPPRFAVAVSTKPLASPLARLQAETGGRVTNLRRRTVDLAEFEQVVIRLLDGNRDQQSILEALGNLVESGDFTLYRGDEPMENLDEVLALFQGELPSCLGRLADLALLAG